MLASDPDRDLYRKVALRLMPILFLAYIFAYLDRANVGYAKLAFLPDLGWDDAVFGVGAGLFYLGYSVFEVPSNMLLAKIGARATLMRIMVLWAICSMALAAMASPMHYYGLRFLLGAAEAGLFPGVLLYLSYWSPPEWRTRFTALFMSAMPIAGIIGGPVSGWILEHSDGWLGFTNWQWLFLLEGAPPALLGIVAYFWLSDRPEQAKWLTEDERTRLRGRIPPVVAATHAGGAMALFGDRRFYALALMSVALIACIGGLSLWFPTAIKATGVDSPLMIGLLGAVPYVIGLVAQQTVALRAPAPQSALIAGAVAAAGWAMAALAGSATLVSVLGMCVAAAGMFAATGPFWAFVTTALHGRSAPVAIAAVTTAGGLGAFIAPMIVGKLNILTGAVGAGLGFYAVLMLVGTAALATIVRGKA